MAVFHVVEKFVSINGEGQHAGELAVFIRLRGCNLKCNYCDTRWACNEDAKADEMTEADIVSYVISTGVKRVTLTGGEPLLADNAIDLLEAFAAHKDIIIEIETNGSVDIHPFAEIDNPPAFTLDYKLKGSGMEDRMLTDNFKYLKSKDTVKFVCSDVSELDRVCEIVDKYRISDKCTALISPVFGRIEPADMVDYLITHKRNDIRLQLQLHKFIWDPNKRGV
ncbi:MAG: putative 7-carboxy-7-deazaguanine synthase QueE [Pseudobutyrivibrio sp.]|uniref:putative 7-carboxy-7-deazaguanine synthase QueE n=1 Tax=Pseudobutyrivibrio sp. TaxID=2014367 RepID=UPI0025F95D7D|nr:putative 7-carboxy-7-deazaguanine synthase QueE [Pseudobutyrivibrio sp.]MBQ6463583.1 putative 7-carboxy-7-deazaguanine synthase QueE [Pseudobutyrivibrio sp.]